MRPKEGQDKLNHLLEKITKVWVNYKSVFAFSLKATVTKVCNEHEKLTLFGNFYSFQFFYIKKT